MLLQFHFNAQLLRMLPFDFGLHRFPRTKKRLLSIASPNLKSGKPTFLTTKPGKSSTTKVCLKACGSTK